MSESNQLTNDVASAQQALDVATTAAIQARAEIADGQHVVNDATASLEASTRAFKQKPTPGNATAKLCAEQTLLNSREALQAIKDANAPAIAAENLARERLDYAVNLRSIQTMNLDALVAKILQAESNLRASIAELTSQLDENQRAIKIVVGLAEHLGVNPDVHTVEIESVKRRITTELQRKYDRTPTISAWIGYTT